MFGIWRTIRFGTQAWLELGAKRGKKGDLMFGFQLLHGLNVRESVNGEKSTRRMFGFYKGESSDFA